MEKVKTFSEMVKIKKFKVSCQKCGKVIEGLSESQVLWTLKVHSASLHGQKKEEKDEKRI